MALRCQSKVSFTGNGARVRPHWHVLLAAGRHFRPDGAVRCIGHRSALHRPSQHAASALAAHCTRHTGRLPYSPHSLSRDCATSQLSPATKLSNHFRLFLRFPYPISSPPLSHFPIVPTTLLLPRKALPHHHPPASDSQPGIVALHTHHSPPLYPRQQPAFPILHHGLPQPTKNTPLTP